MLTFLCQEISFANPDLKPFKLDLFKTTDLAWAKKTLPAIPESIALIEDAWKADEGRGARDVARGTKNDGQSKKTIILIQDAHTNTSGQFNLAKTPDLILEHQSTRAQDNLLVTKELL